MIALADSLDFDVRESHQTFNKHKKSRIKNFLFDGKNEPVPSAPNGRVGYAGRRGNPRRCSKLENELKKFVESKTTDRKSKTTHPISSGKKEKVEATLLFFGFKIYISGFEKEIQGQHFYFVAYPTQMSHRCKNFAAYRFIRGG